jgi:hypothetical protein
MVFLHRENENNENNHKVGSQQFYIYAIDRTQSTAAANIPPTHLELDLPPSYESVVNNPTKYAKRDVV